MEFSVTRTKGVSVLIPASPLDAAAAPRLRRELTGLLDGGARRLVLDLRSVHYIDSSGLGALVEGMKRARAAGGDLRLCAVEDEVYAVLEMTGLLQQMRVSADGADAIAAWDGAPPPPMDRTVFTVSTRDEAGRWSTVESDVVPLVPKRSRYAWRIHVTDPHIRSVELKEILRLPAAPDVWPAGPGIVVDTEGQRVIWQRTAEVQDGWISHGWRVAKGDRPGQYSIDVYIHGQLAKRFEFRVSLAPAAA